MKRLNVIIPAVIILILLGIATYVIFQKEQVPPITERSDAESQPKSPLVTPNSSSTQKYRIQYVELLNRAGTTTKTITLRSCAPEPLVVKAKIGTELTFVNKDAAAHVLFFDPSHTYTIATSSKLVIKADFGKMIGAYPFNCGDSPAVVGVVLLEK